MVPNAAQPLVQAGLLGEAIDAGPALVFVADEDMRFLAVNQAVCDVLGYDREEVLGLKVTDIVADDQAEAAYSRMVAEGQAAGRSRLRCRDGGQRVMDYRASQVTLAHMTVYVSIGLLV